TGNCTLRAAQGGTLAYNAAPSVDRSFNVTGAQTSQTITFGTLINRTYGDAPFTVSATASSGLTVSFSSLTTSVCPVSSRTVTLVGGGTCTIRASHAGDAHYLAAPNVDRSFSVAKANQTLTFDPISDQPLASVLITAHAGTSSGLTVDLSSLTLQVCQLWQGAGDGPQSAQANQDFVIQLTATGNCTLRAAQGGTLAYNAAPSVDRSFNVTGAQTSQTITFGTLINRTYGDVPFTVSATASSGLSVSFASLTTSVCTVSSNTVTLITAGTCTIQA